MRKEDILVGVHSSMPNDNDAAELVNAFLQNGVSACLYSECEQKNVRPNLTIGYDSAGLPHWQKIMNSGIINIMWSKDSVFTHNIDIIEQFAAFGNLVLLTPTPCDTEPTGAFFPKLRHGYLPLGIDVGKSGNVEKEYDILHYGQIVDVEAKMDELEMKMPEFVFKLMSDIYTISLENPSLSFWQIYSIFRDNLGLKLDIEQYLLLFSNIAPIISSHKQIQMIDKLKDFGVAVFGNDVWKKYISGKSKYMGTASSEIVAKGKIVLHAHPVEMSLGLPEVVLKAALGESFVISSDTKSIELEFKDSMVYYDYKTMDDIESKVEKYLADNNLREAKAKKALEIVTTRNSLQSRVAEIVKIMKVT